MLFDMHARTVSGHWWVSYMHARWRCVTRSYVTTIMATAERRGWCPGAGWVWLWLARSHAWINHTAVTE